VNFEKITRWVQSHPIEGSFVALMLAALTLAIEGHEMVASLLAISAISLGAYKYWDEIAKIDWRSGVSAVTGYFEAYSVKEWYSPSIAVEKFANTTARDAVSAKLEELKKESRSLSIKLPPGQMSPRGAPPPPPMSEDERELRRKLAPIDRNIRDTEILLLSETKAAVEQIKAQLISGELIGKGAPVIRDVAHSHRVIPKLRWVILKVNIVEAAAHGHGWSYVGLLIGKRGH
jgi:hypothetical protein